MVSIDVFYCYTVDFLQTKRHKKASSRQFSNCASVNITELTQDEFPVAFIVHDMKSVQDNMCSYQDYDSKLCEFREHAEIIRAYKGKLYMPVRFVHGAAIGGFADADYIKSELERLTTCSCYDAPPITDKSVILCDTEKEVIKTIRSGAKKYIFCNGIFWKVCNEPRYIIMTFGLGHNHGGTSLFIEQSDRTAYCFNALQRDLAVEYGKAIAAERGDTEYIDNIGKHDNIEVLMPEMVKVKPFKEDKK